jgi:hypothetical protein
MHFSLAPDHLKQYVRVKHSSNITYPTSLENDVTNPNATKPQGLRTKLVYLKPQRNSETETETTPVPRKEALSEFHRKIPETRSRHTPWTRINILKPQIKCPSPQPPQERQMTVNGTCVRSGGRPWEKVAEIRELNRFEL